MKIYDKVKVKQADVCGTVCGFIRYAEYGERFAVIEAPVGHDVFIINVNLLREWEWNLSDYLK